MNSIREVPYKPSLILQILMFCNVYLSISWNIVYGVYILYKLPELYDLHGVCVIIAYLIGSLAELYRLRMGYKGNLQSRPGDLCTFLILSPLVELPIIVFLLLSAKEFTTLLLVIAVATLSIMSLEFLIGVIILWPKSERTVLVKK
ncbi:transmembrane protein 17A-like [Musca vetustissima]|uniref:transmembrane protein 17A-like n=1 Tax=Musca vetustissima TaxID=27455 RepID=UPI002AB77A5B|nr:transmembrane protein 17A-like [Musca vetustissima]